MTMPDQIGSSVGKKKKNMNNAGKQLSYGNIQRSSASLNQLGKFSNNHNNMNSNNFHSNLMIPANLRNNKSHVQNANDSDNDENLSNSDVDDDEDEDVITAVNTIKDDDSDINNNDEGDDSEDTSQGLVSSVSMAPAIPSHFKDLAAAKGNSMKPNPKQLLQQINGGQYKSNVVVMEARMHCQHCRVKVFKALSKYPGVEDVHVDMDQQRVTVKLAPKCSFDAKNLFETVKKESGGKITKLLFSPAPLNNNLNKNNNNNNNNKKNNNNDQSAPSKMADVTITLKIQMHCVGCSKKVEKSAYKLGGVYNVQVDGEKVIIKGKGLNAKKVCEELGKRTRKHVEIMMPAQKIKDIDNDMKKLNNFVDKKSANVGGSNKFNNFNNNNNNNNKNKENMFGGWGTQNGGYQYPNYNMSREEKQFTKPTFVEYRLDPPGQYYFSDENPNACSIM